MTHQYLYGPGGADQILADDAQGTVTWALTDRLGTVRDLVNSAGVATDHLVYSSFGQLLSETHAATDFLFGYAGGVFDRATGLDYDAPATTTRIPAVSSARIRSRSAPAT